MEVEVVEGARGSALRPTGAGPHRPGVLQVTGLDQVLASRPGPEAATSFPWR
ncbi:hypothetical protein ACF09K_13550 [Streptomyces sp. NPDC014882]|uniref:hypothetical protein n=1 Tax=Streptomyces sp. NPDC014882 TaxID=3364927 RepID=UPI0036FD34C4